MSAGNITIIDTSEYFFPTMNLRWVNRRVVLTIKKTTLEYDDKILQQMWQGSKGTLKWEDIKLETCTVEE